MNLNKAIKRLTTMANKAWGRDDLKDANACQLGIEALKEVQHLRKADCFAVASKLPGETEE